MTARALTALLITASVWAQDLPFVSNEAKAVAQSFVDANDLALVHSLSELPPDEYLLLVGEGRPYAELGEDYNQSDFVLGDGRPGSQHLFTAISDKLVAFVFTGSGMTGSYLYLVLKERSAVRGCLYTWRNWPLSGLRLEAIKGVLRDRRPEPDQMLLWTVERRSGVWGEPC